MGFLLGIIQAQYPKLPSVQLAPNLLRLYIVAGVIFIAVVCRDYDLYRYQSGLANKKQLTAAEQQDLLPKIWMLTQFKDRLWWVQLDPQSQLSAEQLQYLSRMVSNTASRYDVFKYAKVLAFNGKKAEAEHQLWILKVLHGDEHQYAELLSSTATSDS